MNSFTKRVFSFGMRILVVPFLVFSILALPAFSRIVSNYIGSAFNDQGGGRDLGPIETRVVNGAAYFLKSYSNYLHFLNKIELWDVQPGNPVELQVLLDETIVETERAVNEYKELITLTGKSSYNLQVIEMLKQFDYGDFMEKNQLVPSIFLDVENYLKKGEIKSICIELNNDFVTILNQLNALKVDLDASRLPANSAILQLQGRYARALLFGQYVAGILYEIKETI